MNKQFFRDNDNKINDIISRSMTVLFLVVPLMWVFTEMGVFHIVRSQLFFVACITMLCCVTPRLLYHIKTDANFLKYYTLFVLSLAVSLYACNDRIGIYITLVLGAFVSLFYFDPTLTKVLCAFDYLMMLISEYFRMLSINPAKIDNNTPLQAWTSYVAGYTIEFMIVSVVFIGLATMTRRHLEEEQKLLTRLSQEQERYELALASSKDVLYEYDLNRDILKYYGPLLPRDFAAGKTKKDVTVSENFLGQIQEGHFFNEEDSESLQQYLDGSCEETLELIYQGDDSPQWLMIEGNLLYNGEVPVEIVGKVRNITDQKATELSYLEEAGKDSLTGFYRLTVAERILWKYEKSDSRMDRHAFLYLELENADEVRAVSGRIFCDTLLQRIADVLKTEMGSRDLGIRFSQNAFAIHLVGRTPAALEDMQDRIRNEVHSLYKVDNSLEQLKINLAVRDSLEELESVFQPDTMESEYEMNGRDISYNNDMVNLAFHLFESALDQNDALDALFERLSFLMKLTRACIFEEIHSFPADQDKFYMCSYEWRSEEEIALLGRGISAKSLMEMDKVQRCFFPELGELGGYLVFKSELFDSDSDNVRNAIREVAKVIALYVSRNKAISANHSKSEFLSSMSHEIRSPMNAITGFSELILQEGGSDKVMGYAGNIRKASSGLLDIINEILDYSKIEAGKFDIVSDRYELHDVIREVLIVDQVQIEKKGVEFELKAEPGMPDVYYGDGKRIKQIVQNLLNNAMKFTDEGKISLTMWMEPTEDPEAGILQLQVKDTGIGIPADYMDKVFGAYTQADKHRNSHVTGTGLGLSICKSLAEMMGGDITLESEYGEGATFTVSLPQKILDARSFDYSALNDVTDEIKPFATPFKLPEVRILVVDDTQVNLEVATGLLGLYDARVVTAGSGHQALEILREDAGFDLILMDHLMPEMDGIETTRKIRSDDNPALWSIPVVALTANAGSEAEQLFKEEGFDGYLAKPIEQARLAEILARLIPVGKQKNSVENILWDSKKPVDTI